MSSYVIAALFCGFLCGGWVVVQLIGGALEPEPVDRDRFRCGGCAHPEGCGDDAGSDRGPGCAQH